MKKILIVSLVLNLVAATLIYFTMKNVKEFDVVKTELNEKNKKLNSQIDILHVENKDLKKKLEDKDVLIVGYERDSEIAIHKISELKKKIQKVNSYKQSEEFKSLLECKENYSKLKLNCLKIEEENKTYDAAFNFCTKTNVELKSKVNLQVEMITNKDEEIGLLNEKCINYDRSIEKLEMSIKKEKFKKVSGTVVKVLAGIGTGFIIGKLCKYP